MKIAVGSIFQNAAAYIDRYVAQFRALEKAAPEHTFEPVLVEGDSTDKELTWRWLNSVFPGRVFKRVHGGPVYGSVDISQRWMQIAFACDGIFEQIKPEHEAVIYVEADLMWEPPTILKLLEHLTKVDAAVPMIFLAGVFYDIWAYRKDNVRFVGQKPYHTLLTKPSVNGLYLLDSGGGCVAMRGEVARKCRCHPPSLAMVGFYTDMKEYGYKVWLDPNLSVQHPPLG